MKTKIVAKSFIFLLSGALAFAATPALALVSGTVSLTNQPNPANAVSVLLGQAQQRCAAYGGLKTFTVTSQTVSYVAANYTCNR